MNSGLIGTSETCLKIKTSARTYIVQWGNIETQKGYTTITFPVPYNATNYSVSILNIGPSNTDYPIYKVRTRNKTNMEIAASLGGGIIWLVIGY